MNKRYITSDGRGNAYTKQFRPHAMSLADAVRFLHTKKDESVSIIECGNYAYLDYIKVMEYKQAMDTVWEKNRLLYWLLDIVGWI